MKGATITMTSHLKLLNISGISIPLTKSIGWTGLLKRTSLVEIEKVPLYLQFLLYFSDDDKQMLSFLALIGLEAGDKARLTR